MERVTGMAVRFRPVVLRLAIVFLFVVGGSWSAEAQNQSPTYPKPSSSLSALRQRFQKDTSQTQGQGAGMGTEGAGGETSLKDKREGKGKQEGLSGEGGESGKEAKPGAGPRAQPPGARGQAAATTARGGLIKPAGAKGREASTRAPAGGVKAGGGAGGGAAGAVRSLGGEKGFDPVKQREVEYGEVPDEGEVLSINGPMPVGEFLEMLVTTTSWNVLVTKEAKATNLEFWLTETKPKDALEILRFHDIFYEYNKDTHYLYVMTKQEHLDREFGKLQECEFSVQSADVDYIESALASLLSPKGRVITDTRTRHIFVWDTADNIDKMKKTVAELDVPLVDMEFEVRNADVSDIEALLDSILSPSGSVVVDPRTGKILVKDVKEKVDEIRSAVAKFDMPLEPRIFEMKHIEADALTDSVSELLTERGTAQVDPRTNSLIVTDIPSRQEQIAQVIAALDKKLETRTWVLNFVEPEDIAERIETLVPEEMGDIVVDEMVHQVTVTALPERLNEIDELIKAWDIKRRQVQIEAYLVAVSNNFERSLNAQWTYFDSSGNTPQAYRINGGAVPDYTKLTGAITLGQLPYAEPLRSWFSGDVIEDINGETIIDKFGGSRVAAVLNYLNSRGEATVLSSPRVMVQDGEEAAFRSGRQVPYVTSTTYSQGYSSYYNQNQNQNQTNPYYYGGYGYQPYNRIEFLEVGTTLRVLPRITDEASILLDIIAEDSDATLTKILSNGQENTVPEKTENKAETQVRVRDGQTIVIGGLRKANSSDSVSKSLPILGDIPIIGNLFKNPSHTAKNNTLMVFMTSTIVGDETQPEADRLAQIDESFARKLRDAQKTDVGRALDRVSRGKNEIGVSIGQSGDMYSEGQRVTMEDLRTRFQALQVPSATKVIIRRHPAAPDKVVTELTEVILETELKFEFDDVIAPFVPKRPEGQEPAVGTGAPPAAEAKK